MDMKQASEQGISCLQSAIDKDRAKKLLGIAIEKFNMADCIIAVPGDINVPASRYCVDLIYHMERFVPLTDVPTEPEARRNSMWAKIKDPRESYQIAAMLLTLERMDASRSSWGFSNKLRYELDSYGFKATPQEWNALMAQAYTFQISPDKKEMEKMFWQQPIAIALYTAEVATYCGSAFNSTVSDKEIPAELIKMFQSAERNSPKELIDAMMQTFVPAQLEQRENQLAGFMEFLKIKDFYNGPATADSHDNYDTAMNGGIGGGLLLHSIEVLYKLIDIVRPQTPKEMGQLVMLAVCHDLSELGVYKKSYQSVPVDGVVFAVKDGNYVVDSNGQRVVDTRLTRYWPDQRPYYLKTKVVWTREDPLPIDVGTKSLYVALNYFYFGTMTEDMCSALACHKRNRKDNEICDWLLISNSLCRHLHIADFLASMLGKKVV